ncbi:phosphoribosyltransferase [Xenorhabdus sp. ZM]|uniref:phosphoribosyltransferase n=1 Tax=Xenorhabdus szentirmaii TaxID=290112 RepID=UPI0019B7919C|nr:phosphoribosyltransferase [Xenorhabdus sp. ZM]MBD2806695.1 phosphoribosyltransferase [Xenorhabdus sp. ZM]
MAAKRLKGVILNVEDTLLNLGKIKVDVFSEVTKLINFFTLRGITPVLLANRIGTISLGNNSKDLFEYLEQNFTNLVIFTPHRNHNIPNKPQAGATQYVLDQMQWVSNEVIYIGSRDVDMRTAVNGKMLFLRATWYNNNTGYGFEFNTPKELARFIDTLCLRKHFWGHEIKDGHLEYYALAPFSTYKTEFQKYSENARAAAKFGQGDVDFWLGALVTSMYFTGIHLRIDYITAYPSHTNGVGNDKMNDDLMIFGKCFNKGYLHDLIERHTTAIKSQNARNQGIIIDHHNQLNTIKLNQRPTKNCIKQYKTSPLNDQKTILLVDDICTKGYSLESARKYLEQTGAKVIMVTWLKTINTDFQTIGDIQKFDPYQTTTTFLNVPLGRTYGYHEYHVDHAASEELNEQLQQYIEWDWPI